MCIEFRWRNLVDRNEKIRGSAEFEARHFKHSGCVGSPTNLALQSPSPFGMLAQCFEVGNLEG